MSAAQIAVVLSGFPRRSETFAVNEVLALSSRGLLAGIFASKPGDGSRPTPEADTLTSQVHNLAAGTAAEQAREVAARLHGKTVTGIHGYFAHHPAAVAATAAAYCGVPFGFSTHARDARKVSKETLHRRVQRAQLVVACNRDVAREIDGPSEGVHIVPHGVDLHRFHRTAPPAAVGRGVTILAVGRLVKKKGFDVLIASLAFTNQNSRLRIIGEGPERGYLDKCVMDLGLDDRVEFAGARSNDELTHDYAGADIVAIPSLVDDDGDRDGLPNVLLEAMACAKPIVASNVSAIPEVITHRRTGLLVPARDPGTLGRALATLTENPALRRRLADAARRHVEKHFDVTRCTERFCRILEQAYA